MPQIKCPKCGDITDTDRRGFYCDGCGEKLPAASAYEADAGKRWGDAPARAEERPLDQDRDEDYPYRNKGGSNPFLKGDSEEKKKAAWQVAGYLFAIAALQLICGGIALFAMPQLVGLQNAPAEVLMVTVGLMLGLCLLYAGLGAWALKMPVPAGIVGLVIYIGVALLDMASAPDMAYRGIIIKIFIAIGLIRAIIGASKAQ